MSSNQVTDSYRRVPEGNAVRPFTTNDPGLKCKRCKGTTFERVPRFGFWQETVMPFFDRYPWRCVICGKVIYRSKRVVR